ncbi:hypothetical protein [Agrobacterium sp. SORGH_AS_0440]|uniref:hypothetical protein n=1 Tax=Agrobacterium sp. SORGH_AS_0440 TaxID=3041757 RepID=UPI00286CB7FC|nr:hypothetical protein [Agrobacterium sp. SORGH_AS_0440]
MRSSSYVTIGRERRLVLMPVGTAGRITSNALNRAEIAIGFQKHTDGLWPDEYLRKTIEQGASTSVLLGAPPLVEDVSAGTSTTARSLWSLPSADRDHSRALLCLPIG